MAPPSRFGGGPPTIPPYQHQFPSHPHATTHQPPTLANPAYMSNAQISPFTTNGLGLGAGINAGAAGFAVGDQTGFASHAARSGFQHAAALQQQHPHQPSHSMGGERQPRAAGSSKARIREVWKHNFEEEMTTLMDLIDDFPYVAMDTEFPGIVGRPMGNFRGKSDYHYQCLRVNVDLLNVIQIGLSLFNEKGETPADRANALAGEGGPNGRRPVGQLQTPLSWQFNFKFSLKEDMYNQASIESLQQAGIDFGLLERDGIDPRKFASLFIVSGFVCFDNVKWISFHGGYDFGYLTKLLVDQKLANDEREFDNIMKKWFPTTYDVKHLMKYALKLHNTGILTPTDPSSAEVMQKFEQKSGLESIAEAFKIKRVGAAHQAGSDSLLTGKVFFQLRERIYNGEISDDHIGKVWGLGFSGMDMPAPSQGQPNNTESTPSGGVNGNGNGNGNTNNGGPSTPSTVSAGLASTPAAQSHNTNGMGMGPMTPGGGGGVFGSFNFPTSTR
ncbi:CAF1-domain-containing protein [Durotheca rogersii]|uniref:CAF1-domain-containing protein n=1 Tax=Durotheca rogersii TaxID=419775 RepID=UPI00222128C1|nr:CAF1-domain-containing protein [Durotheca rogersii]KAI5864643.1 CAF1-domain-containing protein [Durotheca rogersii]